MALMHWLLEHHQFLMHQCFSLPFAFLFYCLAKSGYLSLTNRYDDWFYVLAPFGPDSIKLLFLNLKKMIEDDSFLLLVFYTQP